MDAQRVRRHYRVRDRYLELWTECLSYWLCGSMLRDYPEFADGQIALRNLGVYLESSM